jgi:transmembrane sensor
MTNIHAIGQESSSQLEEAADWFLHIRDDDMTESDFIRWRNWIAADECNARAFDEVVRLWGQCDALKSLPWPDEKELSQDDYMAEQPLGRVGNAANAALRRAIFRRVAVAGIAALAAGVALVFLSPGAISPDSFWNPTAQTYETTIAEHHEIVLPDGSHVFMGAKSRLSVIFKDNRRNVTLYSGEALFEVAKDPQRPFLVKAGPGTVRAVGTAFDVKIGPRGVTVVVTEGTVEISEVAVSGDRNANLNSLLKAPALDAGSVTVVEGQKVDYSFNGNVGSIEGADIALASTWRDGRLSFIGATLEAVVADVNRYTSREIIIADKAATRLLFTGTIYQDNVDEWLAGLERVFPIRIVDLGEKGVLIISRDKG